MGQNREKHRMNSHPIIHCPTSEGVSEVSERVLQSVFLVVLARSADGVKYERKVANPGQL